MFGPIGHKHFTITEKQCAELCMFTLDCNVYEYSPNWGQCKLVADDPKVDIKWKDFKFCMKGSDIKFGLNFFILLYFYLNTKR